MKKWKNQKHGPIVKTIRIRAMFLKMQIFALGGRLIISRSEISFFENAK